MAKGIWDAIWHLRGTVPLGRLRDAEVIERVVALLERQGKPPVWQDEDHCSFDVPLLGSAIGGNWLAMVAYDRGTFRIEERSGRRVLAYDLRSLQALLFCLFAAALFFAFGIAQGGIAEGARSAALAFGWLYGGNMALAWARVPRAIRKAVAG